MPNKGPIFELIYELEEIANARIKVGNLARSISPKLQQAIKNKVTEGKFDITIDYAHYVSEVNLLLLKWDALNLILDEYVYNEKLSNRVNDTVAALKQAVDNEVARLVLIVSLRKEYEYLFTKEEKP
jgi:hypothetical protein